MKQCNGIILLDEYSENNSLLQGIAYDSNDDTIWLAIGECVYEITKKILGRKKKK